jgi:zinc transport system ATP-binding protein
VSFPVDRGDYLCIVGENGSGKSTLVKGILGLMPLVFGKIEYNGIRPNEIGYLPQQITVRKSFPASVLEVVLSGCLGNKGFKPFFTKRDRRRAIDSLTKLGSPDLIDRPYSELSGGQQRRVLLARAMSAAGRLLVLDEPVTGLDPMAAAELYSLIQKLHREQQMTIIMVSHDIPSAVKYADKILHMDTGLAFFGSVADYVLSDIGRKMMGVGSDD